MAGAANTSNLSDFDIRIFVSFVMKAKRFLDAETLPFAGNWNLKHVVGAEQQIN